jgi:hypothetical protein
VAGGQVSGCSGPRTLDQLVGEGLVMLDPVEVINYTSAASA